MVIPCDFTVLIVCHRVDGLEKRQMGAKTAKVVCHRIDGLEIKGVEQSPFIAVCHRVDGLGNKPLMVVDDRENFYYLSICTNGRDNY